MSEKTNHSSSGIGFAGLLTILFVALKLTNHITWSWFWVLSPIWISFGVVLAVVVVLFFVAAVGHVGSSVISRRRHKRLF